MLPAKPDRGLCLQPFRLRTCADVAEHADHAYDPGARVAAPHFNDLESSFRAKLLSSLDCRASSHQQLFHRSVYGVSAIETDWAASVDSGRLVTGKILPLWEIL
jgi:hypothetical protein